MLFFGVKVDVIEIQLKSDFMFAIMCSLYLAFYSFLFLSHPTMKTFYAFTFLLSGVSAQYATPFCLVGNLCADFDPVMCTTATGSCGADGCLNLSDEPEDCVKPDNECFGKFCNDVLAGGSGGYFCGRVTEECVMETCTLIQAEYCPETVKDGVCSEDGKEGCPSPMTCSVTTNSMTYACDGSTAAGFNTMMSFAVIGISGAILALL
jgi:hypothetical protein